MKLLFNNGSGEVALPPSLREVGRRMAARRECRYGDASNVRHSPQSKIVDFCQPPQRGGQGARRALSPQRGDTFSISNNNLPYRPGTNSLHNLHWLNLLKMCLEFIG